MAHTNPVISQITLPSGTTYDIHDKEVDELKLQITGGMHFLGETTTEIADGSNVANVQIGEVTVTAAAGDIVIYDEKEFVFGGADNTWHEFGSTGSLKALAFKDNASASYTPAGTIGEQAFTGSLLTSTGKFTPVGEVSQPTFSGTELTSTGAYTPEGQISAPVFSGTDVTFSGSYTPAGTVTSTFAGTKAELSDSVNYTPAGSVSQPTFTGDKQTLTAAVNYTPAGSVTAPEITATPTTGAANKVSFEVANEVLTITAADITALTGMEVSAKAPTFTGTEAAITHNIEYTPTGTVSKPDFTGADAVIDVAIEYTPAGTVESGFAGTQATIETSGKATGTVSAPAFTGTEKTVSVTGTPSGTVSKPIFTGTEGDVSVTGTPAGSVEQATFSGTAATITVQ